MLSHHRYVSLSQSFVSLLVFCERQLMRHPFTNFIMTTVTSKSLCASKNNVKNKTNISNLVVQTCSTFFPPFSNYTQRVTHSLCLRLSESNDTRSSVRQRHLVAPGGTRWGNRWLQSIRIKRGGTTQSSPIRVNAIYQVVGKF